MKLDEDLDERVGLVIIDLSTIVSENQLHSLLKKNLGFPDFYGMNWDAFWDSISGLVEMPKKLKFIGWYKMEHALPHDAHKLKNLLNKLNEKYPSLSVEVEYKE